MAEKVSSSFRDPAGFVYTSHGSYYRQVNKHYQDDIDRLLSSGLYENLVNQKLILEHAVCDEPPLTAESYLVLKPQQLAIVTHPHEWSFSQLKDAALATLRIQQHALAFDMTLKDASAYNMQLHEGSNKLIDILSLEKYEEGAPWPAYRQFCQHFLAPLLLMAKTDVALNQLFVTNIDGVPLPLASKLLPKSTWLNFGTLVHIHSHARMQGKKADAKLSDKQKKQKFTKHSFLAVLSSLESTIKKIKWNAPKTEWDDYYTSNNEYQTDSLAEKEKTIEAWVAKLKPGMVWDLGGNTGKFSRAVVKHSSIVCSWDIDPNCVEINYTEVQNNKEINLLPLLLDLTNPSPAIGWNHTERSSLIERGPADLVMALGLIHHLAIVNNLPLKNIVEFLTSISHHLILEFIPKHDSQVQKLLWNRADIFPNYTRKALELEIKQHFTIQEISKVQGTERRLYLLKSNAVSPAP